MDLLEQAVGHNYRVYPRIRLAELVNIRSLHKRGGRQPPVSRLNELRADFVLCTPRNSVISGIVMITPSTNHALRKICQDCSLTLVELNPRDRQSIEAIRKKIFARVGTSGTPTLKTLETDAMDQGPSIEKSRRDYGVRFTFD